MRAMLVSIYVTDHKELLCAQEEGAERETEEEDAEGGEGVVEAQRLTGIVGANLCNDMQVSSSLVDFSFNLFKKCVFSRIIFAYF